MGELSNYAFRIGATSYKGYDKNPEFIKEATKRFGGYFEQTDIVNLEKIRANYVFALGIFHHLGDENLQNLAKKIFCRQLIVEVPVLGRSDNYVVRSVEEYERLLKPFKLIEEQPSGFFTPPVQRKVLIFKR